MAIPAAEDNQPLESPQKTNGSLPCYWCKRTRAEGCVCSNPHPPTDAELAEMRLTHQIAAKITEQGKAHKARMAELEAEAEHSSPTESDLTPIDGEPQYVEFVCIHCKKTEKSADKGQLKALLCFECYAKEYRRTHKQPPIKCSGACDKEFPKPLLNEQGMCGACAEPSKILYQAMSGPKGEETHKFSVMGHLASSVIMEPIRWIWEQRFPAGKLALLNGPQGGGKTMVFTDIAARVSSGMDWPDGAKNTLGPRKVIFAATEDDEKDTTVPRLVAAGANLDNIIILDKIKVEHSCPN